MALYVGAASGGKLAPKSSTLINRKNEYCNGTQTIQTIYCVQIIESSSSSWWKQNVTWRITNFYSSWKLEVFLSVTFSEKRKSNFEALVVDTRIEKLEFWLDEKRSITTSSLVKLSEPWKQNIVVILRRMLRSIGNFWKLKKTDLNLWNV